MFMSGLGQTYNISIFVDPMIAELGWSRTMVSGLYTAGSLTAGAFMILAGRLLDRYGARIMLTAVAALFGLAALWMSQVNNQVELYLGLAALRALGQGAIGLFSTTLIAIKDGGRSQEIRAGEIYHRYGARTARIGYAELRTLIDEKVRREREAWFRLLERIGRIGPENAAVLDTVGGRIESGNRTIVIDDSLISKIKFIREGQFQEQEGALTLRLLTRHGVEDTESFKPQPFSLSLRSPTQRRKPRCMMRWPVVFVTDSRRRTLL